MRKNITRHSNYGMMIIASMLLLFASCKKDNNNSKTPELGSGGPLTILPNSGGAGTLVTITGSGFSTDATSNTVTFNGTQAGIISATETQLVLQAPAGGTTGIVQVFVNGKTVSAGTYTFQKLSIHGIQPVNGPTGTNIRIMGAGFGSTVSPAKVTVNGLASVVINVSDTLLVVAVPANAGTGPVVVTVNGETATGPVFTYQGITAISPLTGGPGTVVTITGTGFNTVASQNSVTFNGLAAIVGGATPTTIVATVPAGVSTGPVSVTINGERTVGPVFTVVPLPVISALAPSSGPIGTPVTITGTNFSSIASENQVSFNGIVVSVSSTSATSLIVNVPAGTTTGNVVVSTNNQKSAGVLFTVQSLGISTLSPTSGLVGTVVTLSGTGFSSITTQNMVFFNGIAAVVTAATATQLTVLEPGGVSTGAVTIKVNGLVATGPIFSYGGVITLAGSPTNPLYGFNTNGIAIDANGNVYVANNTQNNIIKIMTDGSQSIFAGSTTGQSGFVNGNGTTALFSGVNGMAFDNDGNLYLCDQNNNAIRKISPSADVTTFSTLSYSPYFIVTGTNGFFYVSGNNGQVTRYHDAAAVTIYYPTYWGFPYAFSADAAGNIYYPGSYDNTIHKVSTSNSSPDYQFAGTPSHSGFVDGPFKTGQLNSFSPPGVDPTTGNIIFGDNNAIRAVTQAGNLITLAGGGNYTGASGYQDGNLANALFSNPGAIAVGPTGIIYVLDNGAVREIFLH